MCFWLRQNEPNGPLFFLKFDFVKAYGKMSWNFLFQVMGRIGITIEFISMVKNLFSALAPYIFLIMKKTLNVTIKCVAKEGKFQGIKLPIRQQ